MKINACIGCGSDKWHFVSKAGEIIEKRNNLNFIQEAYSIFKCDNCGLYFKDHFLSEAELVRYYNSIDSAVWNPTIPYPTEIIAANFLLKRLTPASKVLDFGCSEGRFLSAFVDKCDCYGFDLDERAILLAAKKGIKILDQEDIDSGAFAFDFILFSDVFEHSLEPTKLVKNLVSLLKNGGHLMIITGNADAQPAKFDLADFWYFRTPQHLCMLGDKYIDFLVKKTNCQLLMKQACSHNNNKSVIKLFSWLQFSLRMILYKNVSLKKRSYHFKLLKKIPFLKKVTKWFTQPYYPYFEDHYFICLKK